jgi:hypothetical protein
VLYLTGCLPAKPQLLEALKREHVGLLITPHPHAIGTDIGDMPVAADNGCYSPNWDAGRWAAWIGQVRRDVLFATVPDVVGDWHTTRQHWDRYRHHVAGLPAAYVLQDGQPADAVPWDELDAVFIGGSTNYKLSPDAEALVREAKERGRWAHMGRVNSFRRIAIADRWGCDSVDGTFLAFGPDINTPRLIRWMRRLNHHHQPSLF